MQSSSLLLTSDLCGSWSAGEESFSRRRVESNRQTSVEKQQKNNRKSGKSIENRTRRRVDVGDNHCHTGLRLQNPSLFSVHKIHQNTSKYIKIHQNTSKPIKIHHCLPSHAHRFSIQIHHSFILSHDSIEFHHFTLESSAATGGPSIPLPP